MTWASARAAPTPPRTAKTPTPRHSSAATPVHEDDHEQDEGEWQRDHLGSAQIARQIRVEVVGERHIAGCGDAERGRIHFAANSAVLRSRLREVDLHSHLDEHAVLVRRDHQWHGRCCRVVRRCERADACIVLQRCDGFIDRGLEGRLAERELRAREDQRERRAGRRRQLRTLEVRGAHGLDVVVARVDRLAAGQETDHREHEEREGDAEHRSAAAVDEMPPPPHRDAPADHRDRVYRPEVSPPRRLPRTAMATHVPPPVGEISCDLALRGGCPRAPAGAAARSHPPGCTGVPGVVPDDRDARLDRDV